MRDCLLSVIFGDVSNFSYESFGSRCKKLNLTYFIQRIQRRKVFFLASFYFILLLQLSLSLSLHFSIVLFSAPFNTLEIGYFLCITFIQIITHIVKNLL